MKDTTYQNSNGNHTSTFLSLLDDYTYQQPKQGQIIAGIVLRIDQDALFVDVGGKRDAVVPYKELGTLDEAFLAGISAGDEVPVYVVHAPVGDEDLVVSIEKGLQQEDWNQADTYFDSKEIIHCEVTGYNKGGLLVRFGRLEGFVPNSHVPQLHRGWDWVKAQAFKTEQIGETLPLNVLEVEQQKERLVFSARSAVEEQRRQQLLALEPGQKVTGRVTALVKFGAFVDLGQIDGLIHISKICHQHIDHPGEELEIGQEVEVIIESVDVERERISLNRKSLLPGPWTQLAEEHQAGDLIEGRVENVVDFGLFIRLAIGVVGLAHISECDLPAGVSIHDRFQNGDTVLARIIEMNPEDERLGLSLRRVSMREELNWMAEQAPQAEEQAVQPAEPEIAG